MSHHPFRKRNALAQHDLHYGPNMTPMVDVVMVILVFFMASAVFLGPEWYLKTAIPEVRKGEQAASANTEEKTLRVHLSRDGETDRATIDKGDGLTLEALNARLAAETKERAASKLTVVIIPEPDASYESVVLVHEYCQKLGIARVGVLEEAKPDAGNAPQP